jgi:hypothetical protein
VATAQRPLPPSDHVAATLREVLARPEFQRAEDSESLLGGLYRRILRWFAEHPIDLPALPGGNVVNALAIMVMVIALALGVRSLARSRARRRPPAARTTGSGGTVEAAVDRTAEEWEARARELAAAGHARDAALALYQAVLRRFADAGIVRYHASKTPGDYRREMRGQEVVRPYGDFLADFEPIAFGRSAGVEIGALFPLAAAAAPGRG